MCNLQIDIADFAGSQNLLHAPIHVRADNMLFCENAYT